MNFEMLDAEAERAGISYSFANLAGASWCERPVSCFTVSNKIAIIDRIPYKRRHKSLQQIKVLRDIIQARNFLAHTHYLPPFPGLIGRSRWLYLFETTPRHTEHT